MPRLSFLALPWLVREHEIRSTERITTQRVETGTTPSTDLTPETTTVYRLLRDADGSPHRTGPRRDDSETTEEPRSGTPDSDTTPSGGADLREVLAWHPVLIDGATFPGLIGGEPTDRVGSTEPTPVARTLRSVAGRERPDDGEAERIQETDATTGPPENQLVGRQPRTASGTTDLGTGTAPVGIARPWLPGTGTPGETRPGTGIGRSALGFRPRLSTGPTPTVLASLGPGSRAGPVEPLRVGGSASAGESPIRGTPDTPVGRPGSNRGTAADDAAAPGAVERPALLLAGGPGGPGAVDGRPGSTGREVGRSGPASDDGNGPMTLTYRDAGARDGGARQEARTQGRHAVDPSASPTFGIAEPIGQSVSVESVGESGSTATDTTATSDPYGRAEVPDVPFASFPDTDAAIDHVYREIERRQRIDRERRGL